MKQKFILRILLVTDFNSWWAILSAEKFVSPSEDCAGLLPSNPSSRAVRVPHFAPPHCPNTWRAVWRGFNSDSVLRKLFSGGLDFRKTETDLFLDFVRAEEGSGEESARAFLGRAIFSSP